MKRIMVAAVAIMLTAAMAFGMDDFDAYVYAVPYNTRKVCEWVYPVNDLGAPDGYEFYVEQLETGKKLASGTTPTNSIAIWFRTHGHDILHVRAYKTVNGVVQFGEWANTLDPTVGIVNGQPRAWVIFVRLP